MIIGGNNFKVVEKNGNVFFKDDYGSIKAIHKMNGNDVREMKKALRSLQYYDLKDGIRRNGKPIDPNNTKRYQIERNFVKKFEPIEGYIEASNDAKKGDILMVGYTSSFGQNTFDMAAYGHFKEMFLQMVDIYKDVIR